MQSNPVNTDTEGAIESVRINGVSGRNLEKYEGFLSPGTKQPVRIKRVSWMTLWQNNRFKVWPNVMKDTKTSRKKRTSPRTTSDIFWSFGKWNGVNHLIFFLNFVLLYVNGT